MTITTTFTIQETRTLNESMQKNLQRLWNAEYPEFFNYNNFEDFKNYLQKLEDVRHYLVTDPEEVIIGWATDFSRQDERWFGIVVKESYQGLGMGSLLINRLKEKNTQLSGWMIDHNRELKNNGTAYHSPVRFYRQHNFELDPADHIGFDRISAIKIGWSY